MSEGTGLSTIDYTARDFLTIKEELSNYVQSTEPVLWTDFFESNLGVILIDFVSFVGDINSFTADRIAEEVFPVTAQRRNSLIKFGRAVAYSPQGSSPSSVTVRVDESTISSKYQAQGLAFYKGISFSVGEVTFELVQDYYFTADSTPVEMNFTAGTTDFDTFVADGRQWQEYTIEIPDIIDNSWAVYVDDVEWTPVDSLLLNDAERIYEVVYEDEGYITVRFGNGFNGLIPQTSSIIGIEYRYGGGVAGNVEAKSVNANITGEFDDASTISVRIYNDNRASGGENEESNEHIKRWLPGWVKTNNRAVSAEDYVTLINKFTDPIYGSPFRANARLRISGWGNIVEGIYRESRNIPYAIIADYEFVGVGNASTTSFSYTTLFKPLIPNTIKISGSVLYGVPPAPDAFEVRDDGNGNLVGDYVLGGSVDYDNGIIQVSFRTGNPPVDAQTLNLYYEYSPLAITGENRTDRSYLLGVGDGGQTTFSATIPSTLLLQNEKAYDLASLATFGVRLHTTLIDSFGDDVPITLYDGLLDIVPISMTGSFYDQATGAPSAYVTSSNIDYQAGSISVTFSDAVKDGVGVYIYYTEYAYDWEEGTGIQTAFSGNINESIVPGTLRFYCTIGGSPVWIRDNQNLGVWELVVVNTAVGVTVTASSIDYVAGSASFTLSAAPTNLTPVKIAYRAVAEASALPYGALVFVRGVEEIILGGLENPGLYQWLSDRWYLLMDEGDREYALPANVVDIWLWSQDTEEYVSSASDALIAAVREHLVDISIVTVQLNVESGDTQPFPVDLGTIYYDKKYDVNELRTAVQTALRELTTATNRYPGEEVTLSEIYNAVYAIDGILGFRIQKPLTNILLNKNEMASFGKVERADSGIVGLPSEQVFDYGDGATLVFNGTLAGVSSSNKIVDTDNSVMITTYIVTPTGIEKSVAYNQKITPPPANQMEFTNYIGAHLDTVIANSYVDYTTGVMQLTYLLPPENYAVIEVTYWTEHFTATGRLLYSPITGTTVLFEIGDIFIVDDGSGGLSASDVTGTINYDTGDYQLDIHNASLVIPPPIDGEDLLVTYRYTYEATFVPLIRGEVADKGGYCPDWTCP